MKKKEFNKKLLKLSDNIQELDEAAIIQNKSVEFLKNRADKLFEKLEHYDLSYTDRENIEKELQLIVKKMKMELKIIDDLDNKIKEYQKEIDNLNGICQSEELEN